MKKIITFLTISILFIEILSAQNTKFQAIFLYNFTRQLGWPSECQTGDIVIKVLGQSEIINDINSFAKGNPVYGQNVVAKLTTIDDVTNCHILFVTDEKSSDLETIIAKVGTKSVLIVTGKSGLTAKGAGISFVSEPDSEGAQILKYQYNVTNITKHNIKVSSDFKSLGESL